MILLLQQYYSVVTVFSWCEREREKGFLLLTVALPSLLIAFPGFAAESEIEQINSE